MSLTLLKSAMDPALNADKGTHTFTYAFMFSRGTLSDGNIIKAAYELNCPAVSVRGHADECSYLSVSADNVIVETVKPAFDRSGDTVIRLYEAAGTLTDCTLTLGFDFTEAFITDMLEENGAPINHNGSSIRLTIPAFKVITLRLKRG